MITTDTYKAALIAYAVIIAFMFVQLSRLLYYNTSGLPAAAAYARGIVPPMCILLLVWFFMLQQLYDYPSVFYIASAVTFGLYMLFSSGLFRIKSRSRSKRKEAILEHDMEQRRLARSAASTDSDSR